MLNTSLGYLNTLIIKKLSVAELEDLLFDMGFEIDKVDGDEIVIEVTPDRPDLLSTHGMAKAINHFLGEKPKEYETKKSGVKVIIDKGVDSVRPYTVCAVVKNLDIDENLLKEIIDFQEKLHEAFARKRKKAAIGIYPLEKISPPIYYKAEKPEDIKFIPLDSEVEMNGKEIIEKHPKGIEYKSLLEGKKKYPVFVDSKNEVLSMPPIINSARLGKVSCETKEIFIECSGDDLEILKKTLNMIATTLADAGGEVYSVNLDYPDRKIETPNLKAEEVKITPESANKILGLELDGEEIKILLGKMGYLIKDEHVFVPCYRTDILHEIDVVDDVARAYGVNNFKPIFPNVSTTGGLTKSTKIKNRLKELMVGFGFQEVFALALSSREEQFSKMGYEKDAIILDHQVEKSINMLRVSLLPELLKVLKCNQHYEFPQNVFEISDIVLPNEKSETKSEDIIYLSALISKPVAGYADISSIVDSLFSNIKMEYKFKKKEDPRFIKGRVAGIIVDGKEVGVIGEIYPGVLENFKLETPTVGFEIDIEFLLE